jgi:hypothetical protein
MLYSAADCQEERWSDACETMEARQFITPCLLGPDSRRRLKQMHRPTKYYWRIWQGWTRN